MRLLASKNGANARGRRFRNPTRSRSARLLPPQTRQVSRLARSRRFRRTDGGRTDPALWPLSRKDPAVLRLAFPAARWLSGMRLPAAENRTVPNALTVAVPHRILTCFRFERRRVPLPFALPLYHIPRRDSSHTEKRRHRQKRKKASGSGIDPDAAGIRVPSESQLFDFQGERGLLAFKANALRPIGEDGAGDIDQAAVRKQLEGERVGEDQQIPLARISQRSG